jgi:hypothetical protein
VFFTRILTALLVLCCKCAECGTYSIEDDEDTPLGLEEK